MKKLPIGVENFKELITNHYYYVDKSMWIKDIINEQFAFYTRPRRFGKTLNMSMLYYFFSNKEKENAYLFDDLEISQYQDIMQHQNQYPVIFLTLKDMKSLYFEESLSLYSILIRKIMVQNTELLESSVIDEYDKELLLKYRTQKATKIELQNSIKFITQCLEKHYQQKVIVLIDEYDVPLHSAYQYGYYDEMVNFLSNIMSAGLKTNDAVLKGIFTG